MASLHLLPAGGGVDLDTPLSELCSAKRARELGSLGLHTVGELLRHLPRRYERYGELTPLDGLAEGEYVTICARVAQVRFTPMRARRGRYVLNVSVTDGQRAATLTFFNAVERWRGWMRPGRVGYFSGLVRRFRNGLELLHPEVDFEEGERFARSLLPIYPASKAAPSKKIREVVDAVVKKIEDLPEPIPTQVLTTAELPGLVEAFRLIHQPHSLQDVARARRRFKWEEAFYLQVLFAQRRHDSVAAPARPRRASAGGLLDAFDAACPFALTAGQREVGETISAELAASHPMHRLLQGEVGSGKTLVALRAMLTVVDAGGQAALLAPTEVLAHQHARSLAGLLGALGTRGELGSAECATRIVLLTGSLSASARARATAEIASGEAGIVVGTHALLSTGVSFADLGLVVIDEQHRFGVEQRETLRAKGEAPHLLVLTATPIPRTVAITVFGDLDVATLRELPAGRQPVATSVVPIREKGAWLARVWARVREEVAAGHQAFVVCPRICAEPAPGEAASGESSEEEGSAEEIVSAGEVVSDGELISDGEKPAAPASVAETFSRLSRGELAGLRLAALHGRLPAEEKDSVMTRFAAGELDVLVSTTVVEVGVDVPNATVMVVLDADRFGISQLHQLRGRVGRGGAASLCLLVTNAAAGSPARARLDAVASTSDGFELAELDLAQRREGDVLGKAQAGSRRSLRMLELSRDVELIRAARRAAFDLVAEDPGLARHPTLAAAVGELIDDESVGYLEKA